MASVLRRVVRQVLTGAAGGQRRVRWRQIRWHQGVRRLVKQLAKVTKQG